MRTLLTQGMHLILEIVSSPDLSVRLLGICWLHDIAALWRQRLVASGQVFMPPLDAACMITSAAPSEP